MKGKWKYLCAFLLLFIIIDWYRDLYVDNLREVEISSLASMYSNSVESQNDTIKYLKFKLTTLKSINHE